MSGSFDLLEHVPLPAYAFRLVGNEFVLEEVNAAARAEDPRFAALRGRPITHLYGDQPQTYEDARRAVAEKTVIVREMAVRRHDRTEATMLVRLSYVHVEPDGLVIFMENVATPAVAEAALRESEARYRTLVDSLPDAMLLRGADGRVLACNGIAAELFGAKSEYDLLGQVGVLAPTLTVRTENAEPVSPREFPSLRVLETGRPEVGHVYEFRTEGRPPRWLRVGAQPIRSSTGAISGSVTTLTDVTERIAAQQAIRQSSARLDLALAAAKMGVWEVDPATKLGFWSNNLSSIFHLALPLASYGAFVDSVHPDDRNAVIGAAERALCAAHGDTFEQEFRILGNDGITRWARAFARVLHEGGKIRMIGTIMDVTEQHHLEEELRRAHRLESIGRLAGGIAHDFNNLLAAMVGALELIE
ncbi:MAG TPA: PAS domain S-box protein, partial [Polyangiaceae bacterium]|nr:PAS domain S-box protein [Polyangiaceae bacterium]